MTAATRGGRTILPPKGLLIALGAQLPLLFASLPLNPSVPEFAAGTLLLLAGIAVNVWAERQFRHAGVGICPFSPVPGVVLTGPYRIMRNPMYLGLIMICLAAALLPGVLPNALAAIFYAIWLHRRFVLPEEDFLRRELGESYAAYARRVPRWLGLPLKR